MEKTHASFGIKIGIIAAVLVIAGGSYAVFQNRAPELQDSPYIDSSAQFSIVLPQGWAVLEKENSTTSASTWFHNASSTDAGNVRLAVERFERTAAMEKIIGSFGTEAFTQGLIESLWVDLDLNIVKNEKVTIGGIPFIHIHSSYVGKETQKEVTQHMYFAFTDTHYYRIGIDAYTDVWKKNNSELLASIETFKILP
jgi:hypothetical protein